MQEFQIKIAENALNDSEPLIMIKIYEKTALEIKKIIEENLSLQLENMRKKFELRKKLFLSKSTNIKLENVTEDLEVINSKNDEKQDEAVKEEETFFEGKESICKLLYHH